MTGGPFDAETDVVYDQAGFDASVRRGTRPAVVVVDLARGFTDPAYPTGADLTEVVATTTQLVEAAKAASVPVIYTTISYTAAELDSVAWLRKAPGLRGLTADSKAVEIDTRLPHTDADHLITKKGASAFFGTDLAPLLAALQVDTVIVCGATTSGCIRASAVDAVQSGYPVLVPRECVGDRASGPHEANLFDIQAKYGDVIPLVDALAYLGGLT